MVMSRAYKGLAEPTPVEDEMKLASRSVSAGLRACRGRRTRPAPRAPGCAVMIGAPERQDPAWPWVSAGPERGGRGAPQTRGCGPGLPHYHHLHLARRRMPRSARWCSASTSCRLSAHRPSAAWRSECGRGAGGPGARPSWPGRAWRELEGRARGLRLLPPGGVGGMRGPPDPRPARACREVGRGRAASASLPRAAAEPTASTCAAARPPTSPATGAPCTR